MVALLVETSYGETVAIRFPTVEAAREWEDAHSVESRGVVRIVTRTEATR